MYTKILVVVGRELPSSSAIHEAISLAKMHSAELVLVEGGARSICSSPSEPSSTMAAETGQRVPITIRRNPLVSDAVAIATSAGVPVRSVLGKESLDAESIVKLARRQRCDLIVVGSAGRTAIERLVDGSVIPGLISRSRVPVLVCREQRQRDNPCAQAAMPPPLQPGCDVVPGQQLQVA